VVVVSALVDQLDALISHADGYPGWARLLFVVTFALVVASAAVYAIEYTRLRRAQPVDTPEAPAVPRGG
jgi:hypothetical protein